MCEGKFFYIQLPNLIVYVLLNVTEERAELVIQILDKEWESTTG